MRSHTCSWTTSVDLSVFSYGAGIKALNVVFNPTRERCFDPANKADSLVRSQQTLRWQLSNRLLFLHMASLQGVILVETGSESLSWQGQSIGNLFGGSFFSFCSMQTCQ